MHVLEYKKMILEEAQKEYATIKIHDQELDMRIAELKYDVMMSLMEEKKFDEATELTKQFDQDIKNFIRKRIDWLLRSRFASSKSLQDTQFLNKYLRRN